MPASPDNVLNTTFTTTATASTQSNSMASVTTELSHTAALAIDPLAHVGDGIFLQTKTAQGLAGICVWVALFITCQQVRIRSESSNPQRKYSTFLTSWQEKITISEI